MIIKPHGNERICPEFVVPTKRLNVQETARRVKRAGFDLSLIEGLESNYEYQSEEALRVWSAHKDQIAVVNAVIIDRFAQRALRQRRQFKPYGLFTQSPMTGERSPIDNITTLRDLKVAMGKTLTLHSIDETDSLKGEGISPQDPILSTYQAFKVISDFKEKSVIRKKRLDIEFFMGVDSELETGITSPVVMTWTLENILEVFKNQFPRVELSFHDYSQIIDNSFPHAAELSMMHQEGFSQVSHDPKDYVLVEGASGLRLTLTPEGRDRVLSFPPDPSPKSLYDEYITGCPAMVNFGKGSATRRLWDWNKHIATVLYYRKYRGHSVFNLLAA